MDIVLYSMNDPHNKIDKSLTSGLTISGDFKLTIDVLNVAIPLTFNANYLNYNYVYIPSLNRYYYIESFTSDGQVIILNCHVDVLKTYASQIKNSKAHIIRSDKGSRYIADGMAQSTNKVTYQYRKLGSGLQSQTNYVLIIGGN